MIQLVVIIAAIGILAFLLIKHFSKNNVDKMSDELKDVLDNSKLLDIEEEIIKERSNQKRRVAKINQQKEKL